MKESFTGKVYLVGAGPGDPELLTVKARALLDRADVVLHDDLVSPEIISLILPQTEIVNVGKRCGLKKITQNEINGQMIALAKRGLQVVRLKSGDPAIFGRLAEETDALEAARIPFEVVPGITAGISAAASLRVSLTDRRSSSRVVIVTGHPATDKEKQDKIEWRDLVRPESTLVIYMPGQNFSHLREELVAAGLASDVPAVLVSQASTPRQQQHCTTVGEVHKLQSVPAPAILLIGRSLERACQRSSVENLSLALDDADLVICSK
jgi:uroporphyrin-III C-methyltransferase